jgi:uracil DNA glycosylase
MTRSTTGIRGLSFSWRRAIGLSGAEAKISRKIGVPLSRSGRQQKVGRVTGHLLSWAAEGILLFAALELVFHPDALRVLLGTH